MMVIVYKYKPDIQLYYSIKVKRFSIINLKIIIIENYYYYYWLLAVGQ